MKLIETQNLLKKLELQKFPQPEIIRLQYPVMLCHGFGALASLIKPTPMHEVCMHLRRHGIIAFAPNIVPYAKIETRAMEWMHRIGQLSRRYDFTKFNVIAHSMAGLDMRYALSRTGIHTHVASLTTVATPHAGASLAELVMKAPHTVRDKLGAMFDWFGNSVYPASESDAMGAVQQLTRENVRTVFNPAHPDREDITYLSYSSMSGKGTENPLNPVFHYQNNYIFDQEGVNDSFVSVESAKWGEHILTAPLSHLEQIKLSINKDRMKIFDQFWFEVVRNLAARGF